MIHLPCIVLYCAPCKLLLYPVFEIKLQDLRVVLISFVVFIPILLFGQIDSLDIDTTITLPEINVLEKQSPNVARPDSAPRKMRTQRIQLSSLSEILNESSYLSIRNYGPGSLSTISLRGHSASQTDVSLDGFSISSNMNGVYDMTLIPSFFLNRAVIDNDANSTDPVGSIGGAMRIETSDYMPYRRNIQSELIRSIGSFGDSGWYGNHNWRWKKNKYSFSNIKMFFRSSDNDFRYKNLNQIGTPTIRLENGAFRQYGLQQNNHIMLGDSSILSTKVWYVNNHREIPPTQTQSSSLAFQDDELLNTIVSWKKSWNNQFNLDIHGRYMYEHIYYDSPLVITDSKARKGEFRTQFTYDITKHHQLSSFIGHEYSSADVDDYEQDNPSQQRTYLQLAYQYDRKPIAIGFQVKEEIVEQEFSPVLLAGQVGMNKDWNDHDIRVEAKVSHNYRRPTFNDLYWAVSAFSAGNPDLLPEQGWKEELSLRYQNSKVGSNFSYSLNLFHSNIRNWIQWAPNSTGQWTPDNIKEVTSKGLENSISYRYYKQYNWELELNVRYNFTHTTNTEIEIFPQLLNKQLIYIPRHSGNFGIHWSVDAFQFRYQQVINGERFITTDNSQSLEAYTMANFMASYTYQIKEFEIEPVFEIRNLFNTEYQSVANRPMPGIHFQGTIYFRFTR